MRRAADDLVLPDLLRALDPVRLPGVFVYVALPSGIGAPEAADIEMLASVEEPEGRCAVIRREVADGVGLAYDFVAAWITLRVHSSLAAVGLTAAVSTALAAAGISCNVIAGLRHDHLLVPVDAAEEALEILRELTRDAPRAGEA